MESDWYVFYSYFCQKNKHYKLKKYVHDKLIKEMNSGDTRRAESILGSFEIKRLKINK